MNDTMASQLGSLQPNKDIYHTAHRPENVHSESKGNPMYTHLG